MKNIRWVVLGLMAMSLVSTGAWAQPGNTQVRGPFFGRAIQHDVSPPMREVVTRPLPDTGRRFEVNPIYPPFRPERPNLSQGQDPLRQESSAPFPQAATTLGPIVNVPGLSDDDNATYGSGRVVPPDTNGDIGPNHYVQYINSIWAVWNVSRNANGVVTGATMAPNFPKKGNTFWAGFGGPCQNNNDGDPIVLYDHLANRWFVSQFSINEGIQCVAVSTGADPTGSYYQWAFVVSPGENNDYPKIGLMPDAYYMTVRDFPSGDGTFAGFVAFDRAALLAGSPTAGFVKFSLPCLSNNCPDGVQPPHLEGPAPAAGTPGIFSRAWDDEFDGPLTGSDGYRLWSFNPNFGGTPSFGELPFVFSTQPFDSTVCGYFQRACIPQKRVKGLPGEKLDPSDELQMYRAQYRHFSDRDSLVISTTVDADGLNTAGVRWAELRKNASGGGWYVHQDGTYAPADGENRWLSSIAMNEDGAIALGFNTSSSNSFPSLRYTTRCPEDPLGVMTGGEVEIQAGAGAQASSYNRWGDYASMSVDPIDNATFWFTGEYYANSGSFDFKTRIAALPGPQCGSSCTPSTESCTDGVDNDCDGAVDCSDSDCNGDPACQGPVCVGSGTLPVGASCSSNSECCSGNCKGKPGAKVCK